MTPAPVLAVRFCFAMALLAVGPSLLWGGLRASGLIGADLTDAGYHEASMLVFAIACAAVGLFAIWQPPGCPWRPVRALRVLAVYLPFVLVWVGLLIGYLAAARWLGTPVAPQWGLQYVALADPTHAGFWVVVFAICVGAPLAEEIVFRGYLQGALIQVLPGWAAIGITAAVFGATHQLPYALPIGLLGCLFGWLRAKNGSLLPSMFAHAVHNSLTVSITLAWPESIDLLYPK